MLELSSLIKIISKNNSLLRKSNKFLKFVLVDWLAVQKVVQILVLTLAVI